MFPSSLFHIGGDEVTDHYECWDQDASITGGRACMQIFVYFVRHVAPGASNLAPVSLCVIRHDSIQRSALQRHRHITVSGMPDVEIEELKMQIVCSGFTFVYRNALTAMHIQLIARAYVVFPFCHTHARIHSSLRQCSWAM